MALNVGELVAYMSLDDSKFETGLQSAMDGLDAGRWGSAAGQAGDAASNALELDGSTFESSADEALDSIDSGEFGSAAGEAGDAASDALELDPSGFESDALAAADSLDPGAFASSGDMAGSAASDSLELDTSAFDSSIDEMLGQFDEGEWQSSAMAAAGGAVAGLGAGALTNTLIGAGEASSTAAGRIEQVADNIGIFGDDHTKVTDRLVANAESIAQSTGVDPVAIQEAQAMLLTFDSLSDSAGEAGGTFDRVTQASIDLAAQGFGSVDGNARMLGRALEDPERGMQRLERMGVVLNDTQRDQVTSMMEAGDAAGAQAILLEEAEKASGGVAEATADASDKMGVAWQLASQSLGESLLPAFTTFTELAIQAAEWIGENQTVTLALLGVVTALGVGIAVVNTAMLVYRTGLIAWTAITKAATIAQKAMNLAMRANPIGIIITLIAALVAGLIWFFTQTELGQQIWSGFMDFLGSAWEWMRATAVTVFDAVVGAVVGAWEWIRDKSVEIWDAVTGWITDNWSTIVDFLALLNPVTAVIRHWDRIKEASQAAWQWVLDLISKVWSSITSAVTGAASAVVSGVTNAWQSARNTTQSVWNAILSTIRNVFNRIRSAVVNAASRVVSAMVNAWNNARNSTVSAFNNIRTAVSNGINGVVSYVRGLPGRVVSALGNLGSLLLGSGRALIDGFTQGIKNAFGNAVNAAKNGLSSVRRYFPFSPAKEGPFSGSGYTSFSGAKLVEDFAAGMDSAESDVVRQAEAITKAAALDTPGMDIGAQSRATQSRAGGQGVTNNFTTYNPVAEPTSETARKSSAYIGVTI